MSNVSHQNPNFHHINKHPHKLSTKHVLDKTKPTKRSPRSNKIKINNTTFPNTKPLKVVHISNPMKFKATPTEFRALVQGLTGRDAVFDWPDDHRDNHQATVADGGDGSSDGGVTDDQVVQVHQDIHDVTSFPACFEPSDCLNYDSLGAFYHGDLDEDFQALMEDH